MRWGLIPRWAEDATIGSSLINARVETLAEKPSFRDALKHRRCLIITDGFYEWAIVPGQRTKQPYYFTMRDGGVFTLIGLWEQWRSQAGDEITSCTTITNPPNELLSGIHDRMPAILKRTDGERWLASGPPESPALIGASTSIMPVSCSELPPF